MDAATRLRALFEAHVVAVRRYARHRGVRGADADDLVAEVFVVAWRRLDDVPADDPRPWLLAVARNVGRNQARSARRYAATLAALPPPGNAPPPAEPGDDGARLRRALDALSADEQEVLRLVAWDGLTPKQAAAVLGEPDGTVRARLHRARRHLTAWLAEEDGPPVASGQRPDRGGQFVGDGTPSRGGQR